MIDTTTSESVSTVHTTTLTFAMRETARNTRTAFDSLQLHHKKDHARCERYSAAIMSKIREEAAEQALDHFKIKSHEHVCSTCFLIHTARECE